MNNTKKKKQVAQAGITLLEVLMGIGIVGLLTFSLYMSLMNAAKNMGDSKQRSGAVALAQEKMEIIRSLDYEKVGTTSGIGPSGPIENEEDLVKNGFRYHVNTDIRYKDDALDGVAPADTIPTDYKQVRVRVTWYNGGQTKNVDFFSNFIPKGVEANVGGGTLSIHTINSLGQIVPYVNVHIESVEDTPEVDLTVQSDDAGNVTFPGTPAQHYHISLSKNDYENVQTYPNPPASAFVPINPDILVNAGSLNLKTFTMDKSADLTLHAKNLADDNGIQSISFALLGGRKIGSNPDTYTLNTTQSTNSQGEVVLEDLSPGVYQIVNLSTLGNSQYYYLGSDTPLPISLASESTTEANFIFADKTIDSLVVKVLNNADGVPIPSAVVQVTGTDFDHTVTTGVDGLAYFPPSADPPVTMDEDDYDVDITASGFQSYNGTVSVNDLVVHQVNLPPL